jgi:hypothetical protein
MKYVVLALGMTMCLASMSVAEEQTFLADKDTYVEEAAASTNNGAAPVIIVQAMWEEELLYPIKGLVWFDLGGITTPAATVFDAVLKLHVTEVQDGPAELEIFRAAGDWLEMDVTWDTRPAENRDLSTVKVPPNEGLFEVDVTDIVQSWMGGEFPNYGFYIDAPDRGQSVCLCFASREHPDVDVQPELYVSYLIDACEEEQAEAVSFDVSDISCGAEINFSLTELSGVCIDIYDASGALVETLMDGSLRAGDHRLTWDGAGAGIYFVRLGIGRDILVRKAVILQ